MQIHFVLSAISFLSPILMLYGAHLLPDWGWVGADPLGREYGCQTYLHMFFKSGCVPSTQLNTLRSQQQLIKSNPSSSSLVLVPAFCPLDQPDPRPPGGQPAGALTSPPPRVSARWTPLKIPRHQRIPPEKKGGKWLVFMIAWLLTSSVCEETYLSWP